MVFSVEVELQVIVGILDRGHGLTTIGLKGTRFIKLLTISGCLPVSSFLIKRSFNLDSTHFLVKFMHLIKSLIALTRRFIKRRLTSS